ncbi:MAG TPA: TonB-dependent receptor [Steroidobacteraceae bacterium]|jgi:iron complex outermembrane receptor protein|nr:TonB-dependent receptor [Steroidobacteraceae bacterium]
MKNGMIRATQSRQGRTRFLQIPALFAVAVGAQGYLLAGEVEPQLTEVVVTGSRIRGAEPTGSNLIAVDRAAILEAGAATTSDLVRKLPQVVGLGASETASGAQNGAANVTRGVGVNLRGIGSNATLLLLQGRRLPPAGTQGQFTDASVVPSIAIDRLEVVPDGGSAIYGSDAVTGVVNIVPRTNFTGAESTARFGSADGYDDWSVAQIVGFGWSSGHLMAAADFTSHAALQGADRDYYTSQLTPRGGSDLRSQQCSPGTILVNNVPYAIPASSTGVGLTPASFTANTRNLCDNIKRGDIIPSLRRTSVIVSATQSAGDSLTFFVDGYYSRRTFELQDPQITANVTVTNANPFYVNPTGGTGPITVQYDFDQDGGIPRNPGYAQSWQAIAGGRLQLPASWQSELYVGYGASADEVRRTQNINTPALNAALANTDASTAFNPFGPGGISSPATVAAIRNGLFVIHGDTELKTVALQADGPLFSLPAGKVRLAAGAEYREEGLSGLLTAGSAVAPVLTPSDISRHVSAVFAEALIPILGSEDRQSAGQRLELSLAGRYEDYSDFGDTFNPKIGLTWKPLQSLNMRASWGTSFRAPSLAENDPHSSGFGLYGDTLPCNHIPGATTCFGIGIAGGNPDVKPEDATTWSVGLDLTPAALPGLRASLTYFDIDYKNQIVGLRGTAGLLTNPIYAPYRTLNPTPAQVNALLNSGLPINTPINAALVTYIQDGRRQNLGTTIAKGFDADVRGSWSLGASQLSAGIAASYFTKLTTQAAPGAVSLDVVNTINYPQRFRGRADIGWRLNAFTATAFVNYVSAYDQTGVTPIRRIDSYTPVDLHLGYDLESLSQGLTVALDAQNLFDEEPPFVNISGGFDAQSASPLGRLVALSLRKTW